jgi:tRNA uridine 5-carbamoylmethylation protein Kti12
MDMDERPERSPVKPIVIIAGPPGAGKSTVAQELVKLSSGPTAYIEGDTFWSFFAKEMEPNKRPSNFRTVMRASTNAAVPYAIGGYLTFLDFSIPPSYLPTAYKIAHSREVELHYVILRPSEAVCAERAASRAEGAITDYERLHDFYTSFESADRHIVSDDAASPAELAARIQAGLLAGSFLVT